MSMRMVNQIQRYSDQYGIVHLEPNPGIYGSQNGPMFSGLTWLLYKELYGVNRSMADAIHSQIDAMYHDDGYMTTPKKGTPGNFSHDNMTGIVVMRALLGEKPVLWPYDFDQWWHPRDVGFYLYARFPYIFWPLLIFTSIAMIVSCAQDYKYRGGRKILKTDGKLLTFMRCVTFKSNPILKLTFKICTWLIENDNDFGSWTNVARIYFKNENHPINKMMPRWENNN